MYGNCRFQSIDAPHKHTKDYDRNIFCCTFCTVLEFAYPNLNFLRLLLKIIFYITKYVYVGFPHIFYIPMFTFLKLVKRFGKFFFGKSDFLCKIPNYCLIGLPLAKTSWMIVSPQKRVKKSLLFVPAKHSYIK